MNRIRAVLAALAIAVPLIVVPAATLAAAPGASARAVSCPASQRVRNGSNYMVPGQCMLENGYVSYGRIRLQFQTDCNVVLWDTTSHQVYWSTQTSGRSDCSSYWVITFQASDHNWVLYNGANRAQFATGTNYGSGCPQIMNIPAAIPYWQVYNSGTGVAQWTSANGVQQNHC